MSKFSDTESIRTEDFAHKFNEMFIPKDDKIIKESPLKRMKPGLDDKEEVDSVVTEDFESRFRSYLVKPVQDFHLHETWEGSEMSARSQKLRERVSSMFNIPADSIQLPDGDSYDDGDYVNKKFQEIIARRKREKTQHAASQPRSKTLPRNSKLDERSDVNAAANEYATEIRSRSRQIKRELELERQRKRQQSRSPPRVVVPTMLSPSQRDTLNRKVDELDQLTNTVRKAKNEKEHILQDVALLQQNLRRHQAEMRLTDKLIHDNRAKAEDMHTEMSMVELRRDNTMKELSTLNSDLEKRRSQLRELERKLQDRVTDLQGLAGGPGLTRVEIENIIAERDELYELLKNTEEHDLQRLELERQLTLVKDDLRSEQQKAKDRIQALEEELEASITKITELLRDRDALRDQVHSLDHQVRLLEDEKQYSQRENFHLRDRYQEEIQRKLEEHELDKARVHSEIERLEMQRNTVENQLREQVYELKEIIKSLRADMQREKDRGMELKAQLQQLEHDLDSAQKGRNEILEEMDRKLREKEREKDQALTNLREELTNDRNTILGEIRHDFELRLRGLEEKFNCEVVQNSANVLAKDEEIGYLKERLLQQELSMRNEREEHRIESREYARELCMKEKMVWLEENKAKWLREMSSVREECTRAVQAAEEAARHQRERANHLEKTLTAVQDELNEERTKTRNATKDKINAIRHLKEVAKEEMKKEIERIRSAQSKGSSDEIQKLQDQLEFYAEELQKMKQVEVTVTGRESECRSILEKIQKAVVQEINEECAKMADVLEVTPRKVDLSNYNMNDSSGPLNARTSPITAALANIEACGEEIRGLVEELKAQLVEEATRYEILEESQAREYEEIKRELRSEQAKKLSQLRDRLIQEHTKELERLTKSPDTNFLNLLKEKDLEIEVLRRGMKQWKEETAEKLAMKLKDEFKKEFEKKLLRTRAQGPPGVQVPTRGRSYTRLQDVQGATAARQSLRQQLQERVKLLRQENALLRRQNSRHSSPTGLKSQLNRASSNPNLAFSANDEDLDAIPQKEHRPTAMERLEAKVQKASSAREQRSHSRWRENRSMQNRSPSLGRVCAHQHTCHGPGIHLQVC